MKTRNHGAPRGGVTAAGLAGTPTEGTDDGTNARTPSPTKPRRHIRPAATTTAQPQGQRKGCAMHPMLTLEPDALTSRVRTTMGELFQGAEQLRGLAQALDGLCGLSAAAEPEEIKQAAISMRATAVRALLTATTAVGLSERLATVAHVLENALPPEDTAA